MVSPFSWFKTAFTHKATGDVSMSKVGVLVFALAVCFSIILGSIFPQKLTWIAIANTALGILGFFVAVTNRKDSRKTKYSISREQGLMVEQDFDEPSGKTG
jgi:hypothetical protein